jgi:hypothetical protein
LECKAAVYRPWEFFSAATIIRNVSEIHPENLTVKDVWVDTFETERLFGWRIVVKKIVMGF